MISSLPAGFVDYDRGSFRVVATRLELEEMVALLSGPERDGPADGSGRGGTRRIVLPGGKTVYCRSYLRGGLPRYIVRDLYLMRPERPIRELIVTEAARAAGCPVPTVLACAVEEAGPFYRGWLVTEAVENTRPLIDAFLDADPDGRRTLLGDAGAAIRSLHAAGIYHVDLNGNNLLVREDGEIVVIDFDKGQVGRPLVARRMQRGLDRFWRSMRKLSSAADKPLADDERRWLDRGHQG